MRFAFREHRVFRQSGHRDVPPRKCLHTTLLGHLPLQRMDNEDMSVAIVMAPYFVEMK
jgi:hypothetical protein